MRRWRERFEEHGYAGLSDRRKGKPSDKRVPLETVEKVLRLYQETYFDLNVRHFHEKLREEHGIELSYTWVQKALQGAGLVARGKRRGKHRRRRERRPMPGMLLHIDGSKHQWFSDERWYDLIVILDDATSEIYYAQLVEEESTRTVMAGLREVIEKKGLFCALYSDRGSHFFVTPKAGEKVDKHRLTQVGRAMKELGVQMIPAYSPQARGRRERNFGTWQGRLPQELRLAGITDLEAANQFLEEALHRRVQRASLRWRRQRKGRRSGVRRGRTWTGCSRVQTERVVSKDNTVAIADRTWQLEKSRFRSSLAGCTVTIHEHLDGTVSIRYGPHVVGRYTADGKPLPSAERQSRRAVEKAGPWKPWKTKNRFPTAPTVPWKSRRSGGIPTFPPLRRRVLCLRKKHGNPLRQAEGEQQAKSPKPDRSRVNKTGQIDKLTTEGEIWGVGSM